MSGSFAHTLDCRQPRALRDALHALEQSPAYARLPPSLRFIAELILDELASNAIKYGGPNCHHIDYHLDFNGSLMRVAVMDDGSPFNPWQESPAIESEATDLAALKIGGRGIHMIKQATDAQDYRYQDGRNISTLTRQWPRPHESPPPTTASPRPS